MNPILHDKDGSVFYGETVARRDETPFLGLAENDLRAWVNDVFYDAVRAKAPEQDRLRRCSRYYDGFMFKYPHLNKTRPITNYCNSVTETIVPLLTEKRPRPEIVPRQPIRGIDAVKRLQRYASWIQSRSKFDMWNLLATRDASIYGWSWSFISSDYRTGEAFPMNGSVFDLYLDAAANSFDQAELICIGTPISTVKLKAMYPDADEAGLIRPDGICSPSFEACEQPWYEHMEEPMSGRLPHTITQAAARSEGQSTPTGTSHYTPTGEHLPWASTTFLIQVLVRDSSEAEEVWVGKTVKGDGAGGTIEIEGDHRKHRSPICRSGWRIITMTYDGAILDNVPVEHYFPIYMMRCYPRVDRRWSTGDLDHAIPIQKQVLQRDYLLMRGLELSGNPVFLTDTGSGLAADRGTIQGGEVLRLNRGSDAKWLEARGPDEHQFQARIMNARDIDTVTGAHDVAQGERPPGIEAASAIRSLQDAATVRFRGRQVVAHLHRSDVLKALMVHNAKKLQRRIYFMSGGEESWVDPDELLMEYDIEFAEGTGSAPAKEAIEEKAFLLFDRGVLDEEGLLQAVDWMGKDEVMAKLAMRAEAALAGGIQQGGGESRNGGGKKGGAVPAGRN